MDRATSFGVMKVCKELFDQRDADLSLAPGDGEELPYICCCEAGCLRHHHWGPNGLIKLFERVSSRRLIISRQARKLVAIEQYST